MPRPRLTRRRVLLALLLLVAPFAACGFGKWREGTRNGGQQFAEPFRIAGNVYYVGANDIAAFLVTGPDGHVLIDGGYPGQPPLIMAGIAKLGFDIRDVKLLLNSEPHYDHAGGLAELQRASGAQLWASEASAWSMEHGGDDPDNVLPLRVLNWMRVTRYPAPRVDRRFRDGDTLRVGPVAIVARVTPGHTRGCTSYALTVQEGARVLKVVSACSLKVMGGSRYPSQGADFARTFGVLRALDADVWVTSHARLWDRWRKFVARDTARSPVEPFIDREGYREYVDSGEARFRRGVAH